MYKFVALLVVLSSVSLTIASPYGSRLMAHSGYDAAPAPVAPAPGIFEIPAATPFVEVTTAGYGQREIMREIVTEAPVTQGYNSVPVTEAPALELPVAPVTQGYNSAPVTEAPALELPVAPVTQGYNSAPVTEAPVLDVVTPAPELPVAPVTQGYNNVPVTQGYNSVPVTEAPVLDVVTPAPELPVAPVTQGYNSAPVTEIAREEITTPFIEVTTAGYGQREIMREIVTEAPVTQGYNSAPVFKAVHHASAY